MNATYQVRDTQIRTTTSKSPLRYDLLSNEYVLKMSDLLTTPRNPTTILATYVLII